MGKKETIISLFQLYDNFRRSHRLTYKPSKSEKKAVALIQEYIKGNSTSNERFAEILQSINIVATNLSDFMKSEKSQQKEK